MNSKLRSIAALGGTALIVLAATLGISLQGAEGAPPGNVDIVGIDTDVANSAPNTPSSIDTVEGCRDGLTTGSIIDIDVFVRGINPADGISGVNFNLVYDPAVLEISARAGGSGVMFYQAPVLGSYLDTFSEPLPDTDGDYRHEAAEIGGVGETGDGIVARLTIEVLSAGVTTLTLTDNVEGDSTPNILDFSGTDGVPGAAIQVLQLDGAEIRADGSTCPTATPSPTPGETASPTPTLVPTNSPDPTATPVNATPTQTLAATTPASSTCNTVMAAAIAGATTIAVLKPAGCNAGDTIRIGSGATQEDAKIASVAGNIITLVAPLKNAHAQGETVVEVSAAAGATTAATPRTQPATGAGSGDGINTVLLVALSLGGIALLAVAGGSLLMARARHEE